ncbi:alpha/beta fold hydrolase [Desulforhopalus singaporensis]|nr:alpha/beta fold hydrolase [Desulforhopalus singaporensis]
MYPDYLFSSNHITLDGHRMHYLDEGSGPVVVMVHGNPTWSFYYRHLVQALKATHRVIVPDHIGCGLSDKPQDYNYTLSQHIKNLNCLLDHLGIEKFSLMVHDWGGAIGMGVAVGRVADIDKIVVLNTAAFRSTRIPLRIRVCKLPVIGEILVRLFNGFAWPATFMAVNKKMLPAVAKAYISPYDNWANRIAIHRFVADIPLAPDHPSYKTLTEIELGLKSLEQAQTEMMIVWGGRDFCFNDYFYQEWKQRFPSAQHHYFQDGGHYVLEDKKDEVEPLVLSFFTQRVSP